MAIQKDINIGADIICNYLKITLIERDIQKQNGKICLSLFKTKDFSSEIDSKVFRYYFFEFTQDNMPFLLANFQSKYDSGVPLDKIVLAIAYDFIKTKIESATDVDSSELIEIQGYTNAY